RPSGWPPRHGLSARGGCARRPAARSWRSSRNNARRRADASPKTCAPAWTRSSRPKPRNPPRNPMKLPILKKSDIMKVDDLKLERVPVPEWGGCVLIRSLTASELDDFEASILADDGSKDYTNLRANFVSRCLINEDGSQMFSAEEAEMLGQKCAAAIDR